MSKFKNFKRLQHERPEGSKANSVMNMEATVDATPQKLDRTLKAFTGMAQSIPTDIRPEAQIVLQCLFSVFEKNREVKEGVLKDWIFGFAQAGVPAQCTVTGVDDLIKRKYVSLRYEDGMPGDINNPKSIDCWVRYNEGLLKMVGEGGRSEGEMEKRVSETLDNIGLDKEIPSEDYTSPGTTDILE